MIKRIIIMISLIFFGVNIVNADDSFCQYVSGNHHVEVTIEADRTIHINFDASKVETNHTIYGRYGDEFKKNNSPYCPSYAIRKTTTGQFGDGYIFTFTDEASSQYDLLYTLDKKVINSFSPTTTLETTTTTTSITPPEPGPAPQINTGPAATIQREVQQTFHLGDDPKIRDICESSGFLTVLHMVLIIVNILKIAVPLVLIGMLTMDIYPLIGNPGEVSKVVKKSKNRLIAAILIFFVPTIMQLILNALGDSTAISTCYDHATDTGYIEDRKNAEKAFYKGNITEHIINNDATIIIDDNNQNDDNNTSRETTPNAQKNAKTTWNSSYVDTSNKCYNDTTMQTLYSQKIVAVPVNDFSVPMYNYSGIQYQRLHINAKIQTQFRNILSNVADYVRDNSDIIPQFQGAGAWVDGEMKIFFYHQQGYAIDLFNGWCYNGYCPYHAQGENVWNEYKNFICNVCNGKEDCKYNINYIIYKKFFKGNGWCWGGNYGPGSFDPMHFEVRNDGGACLTSNKQKITC